MNCRPAIFILDSCNFLEYKGVVQETSELKKKELFYSSCYFNGLLVSLKKTVFIFTRRFFMDRLSKIAELNKAFALIAKGLTEKEELLKENPIGYPYSGKLRHGINKFMYASLEAGCEEVLQYGDEAAFLSRYITKPIAEWFDDWDGEAVEELRLKEENFYHLEAIAYEIDKNRYTFNRECYDFLETQDSDLIGGTDQHIFFKKIIDLEPEMYRKLRRYVIENPVITASDMRRMRLDLAGNEEAMEAFDFAYEPVTGDCYRCPRCGWTMVQEENGYICHSPHCTDIISQPTADMKLDTSTGEYFHLKRGIMRYTAAPGVFELELVDFCDKNNIHCELWPQRDTYDVEIRFSDGEIWEIDVKAFRNPFSLRTKIQSDGGFPKGNYEKGYYVIPDEYKKMRSDYIDIIDEALAGQENVECVTMKDIKSKIREREGI